MSPINTDELQLYIITVMRAYRSRFRTVRSQVQAVFHVAGVMLCGRLTKRSLANAKQRLEIDLRHAGRSRSEARRIAAQTLRHFRPS